MATNFPDLMEDIIFRFKAFTKYPMRQTKIKVLQQRK